MPVYPRTDANKLMMEYCLICQMVVFAQTPGVWWLALVVLLHPVQVRLWYKIRRREIPEGFVSSRTSQRWCDEATGDHRASELDEQGRGVGNRWNNHQLVQSDGGGKTTLMDL